ncbi:uncharacterized protein LOC121962962 [Plectropomus leopardus]|uniref:uncharacterized protein LOC121962962 n=1 Tax=Plectropomus leopardus TaxID=160734 RepID=UPI001C4B6F5A|nr:uncharacterized protein LOC121962962 [Plectropomus leopardus]
MSDRWLILKENRLSGNFIPSGQQLHRTPPLTVRKHLDFCDEDSTEDQEEARQNTEADSGDDSHQNMTFDFSKNTENISDDPTSMLKGMKGYHVTPSDLEFIMKIKEEKVIKELERDLDEVQRLLQKEKKDLQSTYVCRDTHLAELEKFPSCEDITAWAKVVLEMTSPSTVLTDQDAKSLLAMVTSENIQKVMDKKKTEVARLQKMLANKKKKEATEKDQLEKQIVREQLKIQTLTRQLLDLHSELAQEEEAYKALEMQIKAQEATEIKEEADASEEPQVAKIHTKRRGKEGKVAVNTTEKLQDTTNQSKSTRSKLTDSKADSQTSAVATNTGETVKMEKSAKEARGPQKKVEGLNSQVQAVRGRGNPPGAAKLKNQSCMKSEEAQSTSQPAASSQGRKKGAIAAGEAGETGLRRSKRIASRSECV